MESRTSILSSSSMLSAFFLFFLTFGLEGVKAQCTSAFSIGPNDTICTGQTLTLTDQSTSANGIGGWAWSANGSQLSGSAISSFSAQIEGVYLIELQAFDDFGSPCDPADQTVVVLGNPAAELTETEISCLGACDGGLEVTFSSSNAAAYTYTWAGVGGTTPLTDLCAGLYTAIINDDYGCTGPVYAIQTQLFDPQELQAQLLTGTSIQSCPGNQNIPIDLNIIGGTPGVTGEYTVSWSPSVGLSAANVEDPILSPQPGNMNQTFTATVTDDHGCQTTASFDLLASNSQLQGTVTIGADPCVACEVSFFTPQSNAWAQTISATTDVNGLYQMAQVPGLVDFHLMADPDNIIYPNALQTYYNGVEPSHRWNEALELSSGCASQLNKDIPVLTTPSHNGLCVIRGTLYQSTTGKMQLEDPIPLIDVVVEKTPPGTPVGRATTNVTGEFVFNLMEASDSAYVIYVNFPGVPMGQTHSVSIDANDLLYENLDLCVNIDSTLISICSVSGVLEESLDEKKGVQVYPNPNNGDFVLKTGQLQGEDITLKIVEVSGRIISEMTVANAPDQLVLNGFSAGYYLLVIQSIEGTQTLPVNVVRN